MPADFPTHAVRSTPCLRTMMPIGLIGVHIGLGLFESVVLSFLAANAKLCGFSPSFRRALPHQSSFAVTIST
jgi:hypothetical protein